MGDYNRSVITKKGIALMTKTLAGVPCQFTRAASSENRIGLDVDLTEIIQLDGVQQSVDLLSIKPINATAVRIEALFENASLEKGYYVEVIGLYAQDPDEGEILYSVTTAKKAEWLPKWNGMSTSSLTFNLIVAVANVAHVSILINPDSLADLTRRVEILEDGHVTHDERITVLEQSREDIYKGMDTIKSLFLSLIKTDWHRIHIRTEDMRVTLEMQRFGFLLLCLIEGHLTIVPQKNYYSMHLEGQEWLDKLGDKFMPVPISHTFYKHTDSWALDFHVGYDWLYVKLQGDKNNFSTGSIARGYFMTYAKDAMEWYDNIGPLLDNLSKEEGGIHNNANI